MTRCLGTLDVANALIKRCPSTSLIVTDNARNSFAHVELEASQCKYKSEFGLDSGTASGISMVRRLDEIQDRSWSQIDHVLDARRF